MGKIKIAPSTDEIRLSGDEVSTDFPCKIIYRAEGLSKFKDNYVIEAFKTAIALASRKWQLERCLNDFFGLKGVVE